MLLSPTNSFSAECPVFALQQIELSLILASFSPTAKEKISKLFATLSNSLYLFNLRSLPIPATMAPRKVKKTTDTINSRLALVMKSGKGMVAS
jgi:hypothetical protein